MLAETLSTWVVCVILALPLLVYAHVFATKTVIARPRGQCELLAGTILHLLAYDSIVPFVFFFIWSLASIYIRSPFARTATSAGLCYIYVHAALALATGPNPALALFALALFLLRGFRFYNFQDEKKPTATFFPRRFVFGDTFF